MLQVRVDKSFTDINTSKDVRAASMVSSEPVPGVVTNDGAFARAVLLNTPDSFRLVLTEVIKEATLEDSIVLEESLGLNFRLNIAEVGVAL